MSSTTILRNDTARTGTTPDFAINGNPWRKYVSIDLGAPVRAGVLVLDNWLFSGGPHSGKKFTLVLVATTSNEVYCFSEGDLLAHGNAATPLWHTSLGKTPMMRTGSNMDPPIGVCGTPVVDTASRRMFVVAMWDDGTGTGRYSIFEIALDTGAISHQQELVDSGVTGRATFDGNVQDQRAAINLVDGWLWVCFAAYAAFDLGNYYGWVVAIKANDLTQQLYQPMLSLHATNTFGMFGGGVWGPGGVAAAGDGTVYVLTGNATHDPAAYWSALPAAGPGSLGDYFNAVVRIGVTLSGTTPELTVLDWFQGSTFTKDENDADLDFGGSSPVVLPPIDGRQLVAFVPKDGDIFVLDSQNLGQYSTPLTAVPYGDPSNDTKVAIAYTHAPDGRDILIVGANTQGPKGGFAAFEIDASATPPTLHKLWQSPHALQDSFASPTVVANPPGTSPVALAWVLDGTGHDNPDRYLSDCAMRAYDVLSGTIVYDSTTVPNGVTERVPDFAPITAGANSVFCTTKTGFIGFTQFALPQPALTFVVDRSTYGKDEVDALEPTPTSVADFPNAYWLVLSGVLPGDIGVTSSNLVPSVTPTVTASFDTSHLSAVQVSAIQAMLNAGQFAGAVIPENPAVPDEPQAFLFPFKVSFTGDAGFGAMAASVPPVESTLVTLHASATVAGSALSSLTQIELTTGADPFFLDVNPSDPRQPTWLSFDLRLFKVTGNTIRFGKFMSNNPADAPEFMAQVIQNLNAGHGTAGSDSFDALAQDEAGSALEWNPTDNHGHKVFNFALARVRLLGKTAGPTPSPVRVFFRLFQAQNTVSNFDPNTTYRTWSDSSHKIPLMGIHNNEFVTIPCFASQRINLNSPANMDDQHDDPNAYPIDVTPGVEVDSYFGCWIDNNQPQQQFLPPSVPIVNTDGPWLPFGLQSISTALTAAPHQCLIAEINYDGAPVIPNATTATSDKLAQRNIAWIDGPNPGQVESRRMTHPVQIKPTPRGAKNPDELMIFWESTPQASQAELFLPACNCAEISDLANRVRSWQHTWMVDPHTIGFDARGVTFIPLPRGNALLAGLLTVTLPPGIRRGQRYTITVRQLTDQFVEFESPPPPTPSPVTTERTSARRRAASARPAVVVTPRLGRRVAGAFQFGLDIHAAEAILLSEERLLATLRYLALQMPTTKRWYPVVQRYIDIVAGRVRGFGGDPGQIPPSPIGQVPGLPDVDGDRDHDRRHFSGKIQGLVYDHFGDFTGFVLETDTGSHEEFFSREHEVRELAHNAQVHRTRVRVTVENHDRRIVRLLIL